MTETDQKSSDHLKKELDTARAELALINAVQKALASNLDMPGIYTLVGDTIGEITGAGVVLFARWDWETRTMRADYFQDQGQQLGPLERPLSALHDEIFPQLERGDTIVWNDGIEERYRQFGHVVSAGKIPKSTVAVPLKIGGKIDSSIMLQDTEQEYAFGESTIQLLETLADSMSIALENAQLFDEVKTQTGKISEALERETASNEILRVIAESPTDIQPVLDVIAQNAARLSGSEDAIIGTKDGELLKVVSHYGDIPMIPVGEGIHFDQYSVAGRSMIECRPVQAIHNQPGVESEFPEGDKVAKKYGYRTSSAVPLMREGKAVGVITIRRKNPELLTETQIELIQSFANQAAIAVENVRLFEAEQQRIAELQIINSVQEGLAKQLNFQGIIDLIGDTLREIFKVNTASVSMYDAERDWVSHVYYVDNGVHSPFPDQPPLRPSLGAIALDSRKPLLLGTSEEAEELGSVRMPSPGEEKDLNESYLGMPIMAGEKVIGLINIQSYKRNAFTQTDLQLLQTLANSMSVALENARLFDETQNLLRETAERNAELAVINSVQEGLVSQLDMRGIYTLVGDTISKITGAGVVMIANWDWETRTFHADYFQDQGEQLGPMERPFSALHETYFPQIERGETLVVNEGIEEAYRELGHVVAAGKIPKTSVAVPLKIGGKISSAVMLQDTEKEYAFSESTVQLVETLAGSMGVALENARLFDETQRLLKETEERNAELAIINSVQEGLVAQINMQEIFDLVGDKIRDIFNAYTVMIGVFSEDGKTGSPVYLWENGERYFPSPMELKKGGISDALYNTQRPILFSGPEDWEKYGAGTIEGTEKTLSGIYVPMIVGNHVKGVVSIQDLPANAFDKEDLQLLTTLTNSMSIALENARLFDETQRLLKETEARNAELAVINSVQEGLVSNLDMQAIYDLVGDKISQITGSEIVVINTWNSKTRMVRYEYIREKGERFDIIERPFTPMNETFIPQLERGVTLNTQSGLEELLKAHNHSIPAGEMPRSVVTIPIQTGNEIRTSVSLQDTQQEHAFSESTVQLVETLARSMGIALENAQLFEETAQRNAELAIINAVQSALAGELDLQDIFSVVGEKLHEVFHDAQTVDILTYDPETNYFTPEYVIEKGERFEVEPWHWKGFWKHIIESGKPLLINQDMRKAAEKFNNPVIVGEAAKSWMGAPMMLGGEAKGVISIQHIDRENAFRDSDLRLLTTLANSLSVALENARLFDETQRLLKETEERNAELAVINSVQEALAAQLDLKGIYDAVGDKIQDIFKANIVLISTIDHQAKILTPQYLFEDGNRQSMEPVDYSKPPWDRAIEDLINHSGPVLYEENVQQLLADYGLQDDYPSKTLLYVPLTLGGQQWGGYFSLQDNHREHAYSPSDVRLLQTLANSMSVALENARLFDETQRLLKETEERNAELAVINSVQEALAAQLDLQGIYNAVGDKIQQIFDAQSLVILTLDHQSKTADPKYFYENGKRDLPGSFPFTGLLEHLITTGNKVVINEDLDEWSKKFNMITEGEESKSGVWIPFKTGGEVRGIVSLQNTEKEHAFSESDVRLLETLANSMSVALESARLFDETQRLLIETEERNAELAVINSVQQGMVRELNFQSIINLVGDELRSILKTDNLGIRIIDHESQMVAFPYEFEKGRRLDLSPSPLSSAPLTRNIVETKHSVRGSSEEITEKLGLTLIPGTEKSKSLLAVPILVGDEVRGLVSTESFDQENAFSVSDQRLLETLAYSMGVALENARLFDETQRLLELTEARNAELAIINSISQALTQELDLETLIDQVGDKIRLALNTENFGIGLYDKDSNLLTSMYVYKNGERVYPEPTLFNEFNRRFADQGKSLVLNDVSEKLWKKMGSNLTFGNDVPKSVVMVPILASGELIGGITLQNFASAEAYPEPMVRLLETIASNMGTAIQNARLFENERQRAAEFSVINKVSQALVAEPELDKMIQLIGNQATSIFNADIAYLALLNPQTNLIEFPFQFGDELEPLPLGQGLTSTIIRSGEPLILNRDMDEHSSALGVSRIGRRARSFLGVPIQSGKETIGVLSVQSVSEEGAFDDDDLRLLTTIAANAGAGIHTAQLHAETQRRAGEMATLAEIGNDIASTRDLDTTLRKIAERAKKLLNVGDIALYLMDETGEKIVPRVVLGEYVDEIMATPIPVGTGISGMVVKNGVAELVINPTDHPNTITIPGTPEFEEEPEGMMSAPLFSGGKVIGLINVWRKHKIGLFSESELDFLVSVARQTAIAIDSAQLYLETEHHAEQMSTLESVGREISSDLDLQSVLERIGERALTLLKGRSVAIRLLDDENVLLPVVALGENAGKYMDHRIRLGDGITGNVAQTGKAEIINQPLEDERLKLVPGTGQADTQALIISPLTISDSVIGTLSIWRDKSIHGRFSDSDLGFAIGLARQAAIAITNANLFKEVERQKEYFEALITSAPVAIITIGLDGCVTGWSPAAVSLFGYTEEEAIGANIDDLVSNHPDVREDAEKLTQHYLNDIGKIQLKSQRTNKDGRLIDVAINAMPVLIDGEVSGYIAIYNDISELEKARRDAEEANHAKSAFLANMSHELRTPLNAIIGFTRIVKRKGEKLLPEKQIENLDKVLVSAEHLLGLINTVLDISKIEAGRMEVHATSFDLKLLINLVAATTQPLLKDGNVAFSTHIPDDLPMVHSDIEKIKQILINLVSNAAKFTHQGEISVNVRQVKDQVEIDVADTGIGISPEAIEHIFEEFQQADSSTTREYGGTGLGLSISRSLARLLEGDLRVASELGVGSTFTVSFPIIFGQTAEETATPQAEQSSAGGTEPLILVIDDNEDAIYLMREMLEGAGYRVAVARDGDEGLAMAGELAPFAITLDIMMPKKDGWQVLHDLKANPITKSIPVILISIVDQKALGYRLGAEDYLIKPLQEDEIITSLQHIKLRGGDKPLKKLLVVDDDPMVKDMISQLLEGKPYEIQSASDGLDALEKIKADKPDAILLDLMMPKLDGFGLLERLKQDSELADLPVIVLTAKLLNQKEKEALRTSAGQVIQKQGISGEQLLSELRETIRKTV